MVASSVQRLQRQLWSGIDRPAGGESDRAQAFLSGRATDEYCRVRSAPTSSGPRRRLKPGVLQRNEIFWKTATSRGWTQGPR